METGSKEEREEGGKQGGREAKGTEAEREILMCGDNDAIIIRAGGRAWRLEEGKTGGM